MTVDKKAYALAFFLASTSISSAVLADNSDDCISKLDNDSWLDSLRADTCISERVKSLGRVVDGDQLYEIDGDNKIVIKDKDGGKYRGRLNLEWGMVSVPSGAGSMDFSYEVNSRSEKRFNEIVRVVCDNIERNKETVSQQVRKDLAILYSKYPEKGDGIFKNIVRIKRDIDKFESKFCLD